MTKPTILSPWFVVIRVRDDGTVSGDYKAPEYYVSQDENEESWTTDPKEAMLFNSIHSAHRIARATAAYAVVVADEEDYKLYRTVS